MVRRRWGVFRPRRRRIGNKGQRVGQQRVAVRRGARNGHGADDALLTCLDPNPPAAVLNILLNDAFLPPRGDVAEISIKQVMAAHGLKASVDHARFALLDLVDGGLHVVIDAAPSYTPQRRKRPRMGIKEHFMGLRRVGHQPEGAARAQLHVRNLHLVEQAAYQQALFTPVKLEGFAVLEEQRDKGFGILASLLAPGTNKVCHRTVAAAITLGSDLHEQRACSAPVIFVPQLIGLSACSNVGSNEESLRKSFPLRYFGVTDPGALSHFLMVLHAKPVRFAISLIEILSRILMRLTLPYMSIVITSAPRLKNKQID